LRQTVWLSREIENIKHGDHQGMGPHSAIDASGIIIEYLKLECGFDMAYLERNDTYLQMVKRLHNDEIVPMHK
jgi:hypothetical protein